MFLRLDDKHYDRYGQQMARGLFLILFSKDKEIRAVTRTVTLRQLGHFMMGSARVGGKKIAVSGAFGNDGLPRDAPASLWDKLLPVPQKIAEQFWHDKKGSDKLLIEWATKRKFDLNCAGLQKKYPPDSNEPLTS